MMEHICEQQASICDVKRLDLMLQSVDTKIIKKTIQIVQPFFSLQKVLVGALWYIIINQASSLSPAPWCSESDK